MDASLFSIDGASGVLSFNTPPDYENASDSNGDGVYEVQITADDSKGGRDVQLVSVTVNNTNDNAPHINNAIASIGEMAANNAPVIDINSAFTQNDTDLDSNALTYSIVAGNTDGVFSINASTGEITVIDNSKLDYASTQQYNLTIEASDGINSDTAAITIEVIKPNNTSSGVPINDPEADKLILDEEDEKNEENPDNPYTLLNDVENIIEDETIGEAPSHEEEKIVIDVLEAVNLDSLDDILNRQDSSGSSSSAMEKPNSTMTQQLLSLKPIEIDSQLFDSLNHIQSESFRADLEKMYQDIDESIEEEKRKNEFTVETATGISISLTAGFVAWLFRSGSLIASLFATMPMWRNFDPVSILSESEDEEETADKTKSDKTKKESHEDQKAEQIFDKEK